MKIMKVFGSLSLIGFLAWTSLLGCGGQQAKHDEQLAAATREIGEAYMRQGDYTAALRELLAAERMAPDDPFVHNDLGLCYMVKKRMPVAITHFKKAVALNHSYTPARNNLGVAYMTVEDWDTAIATFKEITKDVLYATPQFPLSNLGVAYYNKGEYKTALNYYKEALKIQPDFYQAHLGTGRTYLSMNQGRLALRYLERAAQLSPKIPEVHYYLGETYLLTGQADKASFAYDTVIDLASPESDWYEKAKRRLEGLR